MGKQIVGRRADAQRYTLLLLCVNCLLSVRNTQPVGIYKLKHIGKSIALCESAVHGVTG